MAKTSAKYWKDRAARDAEVFGKIDGENGIIKREKDAVRRQDAIYKRALDQLNEELNELEKEVGKDAMTQAAMQKPLKPKELEDWSKRQEKRLETLIAQYGETEGRKRYGIEIASTGKQDRANRIVRRNEALKQSIQAITAVAACESENAIEEQLKKEAAQGEADFKKQFPSDFRADFNKVDAKTVENITHAVWKGDDFSDRVWANKHDMAKHLEQTIALGVTNGWSVKRMASEMERYVQSGKHSAERIVRTEMNRVSNATELESYKANGIKYYRFIATEDARVCEICGGYGDKVFAVDEAASGVNFPPMHPNCRCRTVLSTEDENGNEDDSWLDDMQAEIDDLFDEFDEDSDEPEPDVADSEPVVEKWTKKEAVERIKDLREYSTPETIGDEVVHVWTKDGEYHRMAEDGFDDFKINDIVAAVDDNGETFQVFKSRDLADEIEREISDITRPADEHKALLVNYINDLTILKAELDKKRDVFMDEITKLKEAVLGVNNG